MRSLFNDARVALRIFSRRPGFSLAAVLTLAVGIGATATIFSFVNAVLIRPLPYPESDRLVMLQSRGRTGTAITVRPGDFLDWQAQSTGLAHMAAFVYASVSLTGADDPERLRGASVTSRWFETLGVAPVLGTSFQAYEGRPEAADVAVISHGLWSRRFRSDRSIVGKPIVLNNRPFTVIGVAAPDFSFPKDLPLGVIRDSRSVDVWLPLVLREGDRGNYFLEVVARLEPNVTIVASRVEMDAIAVRLEQQFPRTNKGSRVSVAPIEQRVVGDVRGLLFLLAGAGAFVLLIAAVNVANLLLVRATERQREVAIRSALGSSRWRLIRLLVTESVVLSLAGGLCGLFVALWGVDLVAAIVPPGALPRVGEVVVDRQALAFVVVVSLMVAITFGAIPALIATRKTFAPGFDKVTPSAAAPSPLLKLFVVAEVALTFVLLTGAGLLVKSFARLTSVDPGFRADRVLTLSVALPEGGYETTSQMNAFTADVLNRFTDVPDVLDAGAVNWLPIGGGWLAGDVPVEPPVKFPPDLNLIKTSVGGQYFKAMGIPLLAGRDFDERDGAEAAGVVIVTDGAAQRVWPGESAIGKRVKLGFGDDEPWRTVIGTVADVKQQGLATAPQPAIYFPIAQTPQPFLLREGLTFVVRTSGNPQRAAAELTRRLRSVDRKLPIDRVRTMDELVGDSVSNPRFRGVVFASFAAVALLLVMTGIIGVLAYSVARRTREIGVRMALGADRAKVLGLVLRQALSMTALGLVAGVVAAIGLTRLLSSYLFEVTPRDPAMFTAAAILMLLVAAAAAYLPARRAASVDPLISLRQE